MKRYFLPVAIFFLAAGLAYLSFATVWDEIPFPHRYTMTDDVIYLSFAKNFVESWTVYDYERLAAPFTFDTIDFPFFTFANFVVIAIIDVFAGNIYHSVFWYFIISIGASSAIMWWLFRLLNLSNVPAALGALAYGLSPYALTRNVGHLDYAVAVSFPLFLILIVMAMRADSGDGKGSKWLPFWAFIFGAFTVVQQFYYSFYVLIFITTLWLFWFLPRRAWWGLATTAAIGAGIVLAFVSFVLLFQWDQYQEIGRNLTYTQRSVLSTNYFALILSHLVVPQEFHRIEILGKIKQSLHKAMSDNGVRADIWTHSLGLYGTIGLGYLGVRMLTPYRAARAFPMAEANTAKLREQMLIALAMMTLIAILYGVSGGGATLLAFIVSPQFHGVQRIALAIACFCAVATTLLLQSVFERIESCDGGRLPLRQTMSGKQWAAIAFVFGTTGIYLDQTIDYRKANWFYPDNLTAPQRIAADQVYFKSIEAALKSSSGVYIFPHGPWSGLMPYQNVNLKPLINTDTILWSAQPPYARQAYNWGTELARLDFNTAMKRLTGKGFSGVLVNTQTYEIAREHPYFPYPLPLEEFLPALAKISPKPPIISADGNYQFFMLPGYQTAELKRNCEPYRTGTPLDLSAKGFNFRYFDLGWAQPAETGTWMARANGFPAYLRLCLVSAPTKDLTLTLDLTTALHENGKTLDMDVIVNGQTVEAFVFTLDKTPGQTQVKAIIPQALAASKTPLSIGFRYSRGETIDRDRNSTGGLLHGLTLE